jgi:hypothetical protein
MAQSRWALTGTPIINNLKDLYSLVRFLQPQGVLKELQIFHGAIIRPVTQGETQGNKILQLLMSDICLRRKKEMSFIDLRLPELTEYVHKVTLLPHEKEKYQALEAQAKGTLEIYRHNLKTRNNPTDTYRNLLEVLLRMRQLCNHWKLISEERLESIMKQLEAEGRRRPHRGEQDCATEDVTAFHRLARRLPDMLGFAPRPCHHKVRTHILHALRRARHRHPTQMPNVPCGARIPCDHNREAGEGIGSSACTDTRGVAR